MSRARVERPRRPGRSRSRTGNAPAPENGRTAAADETAQLRASLESTRDGLMRMLQSLHGAGLQRAILPYAQMQRVLVLQRAHCRAEGITELDPLWVQLARTARGINELLDGFAGTLRQVAELDRSGVGQPVSLDRQALDALIEHGPMTPRRLAAVLQIPNDAAQDVIEQMIDADLLERATPHGMSVRPVLALRDAARAGIGTLRAG